MKKNLYKSSKSKMLCGVCGGWAEFLNWDPTLVRFIFVILGLIKGFGVIIYIIAAIIMPSAPDADSEAEAASSEENNSATGYQKTDDKPHSDEEFDSYFEDKK